MKKLLLLSLALLCACATTKPPTDSEVLKQIGDDYWQDRLAHDVGLQIKFGIPIREIPDASYAEAEHEAAFAEGILRRLDAINLGSLNEEERLTYSILRWKEQQVSAGLRFFWLRSPVTPYASSIRTVNRAFTDGKIDPSDRERLLKDYARFIDQIAEVVREQQRRGILLPKPELPVVKGVINSYVTSFRASGSTAATEALQRLASVFDANYEAAAPSGVGMSQYPGGDEAYRFLIHLETSYDKKPEDIHALGMREVDRINKELEGIRQQVGFNGDLAEFRQFLKTDPRFFGRTPDEIGQRLTGYIRKIEPQIPRFFAKSPRATYDVKRLDPALEGAMTFGYYQQPTASDPVGHYFYNGSKPAERNLLFAPALMLHELIPGHHFQIARQEENEDLPQFRRESFDTAFVEGWGEYAAALGREMGMYDDPYDHAGRLVMDALLSVRLVVDTGMNALGWSREKAMQYMRENTFMSETEIATESLRYSVDIPAQALAYKIGSMKMIDLRNDAQKALGPRFDIKQFHEWLIASGSMPLSILEQHVTEKETQRH